MGRGGWHDRRMSVDKSLDALNLMGDSPRAFDTAMRGYDRRQVDDLIRGLDEELRTAAR